MVIGENEIEKGIVSLKDMKTGIQKELKFEDLTTTEILNWKKKAVSYNKYTFLWINGKLEQYF